MIKSAPISHRHTPTKTLIPTRDRLSSFALIWRASFALSFLLLIAYLSAFVPCSLRGELRFEERAMKVHPAPKKRNSVAVRYLGGNSSNLPSSIPNKKLRRLPHIFNCVLELPFHSDAEVSVEEGPNFFRFLAETDVITGGFGAHMVEIYPGVTKIVVRPNGHLGLASLDELELDMWRFRLPESTRPELASAVFEGGELVVTVPKGDGEHVGGLGDSNTSSARLVLVQ